MRRITYTTCLLALALLTLSSCQEGEDTGPTGPNLFDDAQKMPVCCEQMLYMAHQSTSWIDMDFSINLLTGGKVRLVPRGWGSDYWFEVQVMPNTVNTLSPSRTWDFTISVEPIGSSAICYNSTLIKFDSDPFLFSEPVSIILCHAPWVETHHSTFSLYEVLFDEEMQTYSFTDEIECYATSNAGGGEHQYRLDMGNPLVGGGGDPGGRDWVFDPGKKGDGDRIIDYPTPTIE
ncbi:hypothetical protein H8E07_19820 [bacterium]|nr:hypothetical protein [bacterium]